MSEETWLRGERTHTKFLDGECWPIFVDEGGRWVAVTDTEEDADAIIRDHQQAQQVAALRAALEEAERVIDPAFTIIGREEEEDEPDERSTAWMTKANESTKAMREALAAILPTGQAGSGKETT